MTPQHYWKWIRSRAWPTANDYDGSRDELELQKLKGEIAETRKCWLTKTFSWSTIIGAVTLYAIWASGVIDVKRERLANETALLEIRKIELKRDVRKQEGALRSLREQVRLEQEFRHAVVTISEHGGRVKRIIGAADIGQAIELPHRIRVVGHFVDPHFGVRFPPGKFSAQLVTAIRAVPNVTSLRLGRVQATAEEFGLLISACPKLRQLFINVERGDWEAIMVRVCLCEELIELSISGSKITPEELHPIANLPKLEVLDLVGNEHIDDDAVEILKQCSRLREVDLRRCSLTIDACRRLVESMPLNSVVVAPDGAVLRSDATQRRTGNKDSEEGSRD